MAGGVWLLAFSSEIVHARRKLLDCGNASNQWAFVFLGLAVGLMLGILGTWIHAKQRQWAPSTRVKQTTKYSMYGIGLPMMLEDGSMAITSDEVAIEAQPVNLEQVNVLVHGRQSTAPTQAYGTLEETGKELFSQPAAVAQYDAAAVVITANNTKSKCEVQLKGRISDEGYAMWLTPPNEASSISSPMSLCTSAEQQVSPPSHPLASTSNLFRNRDASHTHENKAYSSDMFQLNSSTETVPGEPRAAYTGPRTAPNCHFGRKGSRHVKGIHESRALAFSLRKFPVDARRITSCPIATLTTASPNSSVEFSLSQ